MEENLELYEAVRAVPTDAQRTIKGGRLNGKTDINPMWRIKTLTEHFGICGIGWYYEITKQWIEQGHGGEIAAFCNINLYVKHEGEWSKPIQGTGGSAFVASEQRGLYTSDECYKMALTDAISVACKALGFGADIYWDKDRTKYNQPHEPAQATAKEINPELLPGGKRFYAAVEGHAKGLRAGAKSYRDVWAANVNADATLLSAFDQAVNDYKVNNNI